MENDKKYRIDGILWHIDNHYSPKKVDPLCPTHLLRLDEIDPNSIFPESSRLLSCPECDSMFELKRMLSEEKKYVLDKIDSKKFSEMETINIDGESISIVKDRIDKIDNNFWIETKLTDSKMGKRIVVYVGDRKHDKNKSQIFVEPEIKRLSFDHNDHHPLDVFTKIEVIFDDGSKHVIQKSEQDGNAKKK